LSVVLAALGALTGCYSTGDGPSPTNGLYFPVGLAVSPGGHALYVANSDFDLQFNSGTVQVYDLDDLRAYLKGIWSVDSSVMSPDICAANGLGPNPDPVLYPGPCGSLNLDAPPAQYFAVSGGHRPIQNSAAIGAFATDIAFVCHPPADPTLGPADCSQPTGDPRGARLFVPVRGDPSVTFFEVDDDRGGQVQTFRLDCDQGATGGRCVDTHRIGVDASENTRGLTLPAEPFGIAVSDRADAIAISHQITGGAVSLITGRGVNGASVLDVKPRLEFVGSGLPAGATGITALPIPAIIPALGPFSTTNYQEGFALGYRGAAEIDVFRFFDDQFAAPARPFLNRAGAFGLSATPSGLDSRGVLIDRSPEAPRIQCERTQCPQAETTCTANCDAGAADQRDACVKACNDVRLQCLSNCTRIPLSIYVANRSPAAMLVGDVSTISPTGSSDSISFFDSVPLAPGPSRVIMGRVRNRDGNFEPRIFVVCFDARLIFIYDPVTRRVDGQIRTGRGPHPLVMDPVEAIAYVGHFTDSYIGLIDLDQRHAGSYASIVATIGAPQPPQDSK
jgi:hypothetical protein